MRRAFTLLEILIVCVIIGITLGVAAPRIRTFADSFAVDAAAREVAAVFALARLTALRERGAEVRLDTTGVRLIAQGRVIRDRAVAQDHGVRMRTTVASVRYTATGVAFGLSNGSIYLSRGGAADTVFISRLGRVRR
jgi:prepilin-type N-terminal cleavage/methylation domain-containing protein